MNAAIPAPQQTTLPGAGSTAVFPVGRVFCIGRNYPWSFDETARPADMPAWFMKPASAVVQARGVLPCPPGTRDFCHEIELVVAIGFGGRDLSMTVGHAPAQPGLLRSDPSTPTSTSSGVPS